MITVTIAEDQTMLRNAMVQLINLNDEIEVIGETGDGNEALTMIKDKEPVVALLDIEMPGMSGLEVLSKVKQLELDTKIIIITTFKRPGYFEKAVANDVDAYVLKERSIDELMHTIQKLLMERKNIVLL